LELEKSALYIVGTPIGNLADMTYRAVETLKNVGFIAAEDTRVTAVLLREYGIKTGVISCREHNITTVGEKIADRIQSGENCAYVTDAGTPCVSDPGGRLVNICVRRGIPVFTVPGASAVTAAVSLSGFDTSRFCFEGFLSVNKKKREYRLNYLKNSPYTLIFYEAPHRIAQTLAELLAFLGDREAAVCRELTKIHEEVIRGKLSEITAIFSGKTPKGEFAIIIDKAETSEEPVTLEEAAKMALKLKESGVKPSDAVKIISEQTGLKKTDIYKEIVKEE